MDKDEVRILADEVLKPILGPMGFRSSDIETRADHAGDEALYVTVHFAPGSDVASGRSLIDASVALQDALALKNDNRFPYFRYDYPDDPAPFDEVEAYGLAADGSVS